MKKCNPFTVGLYTGLLIGFCHFVWAALVAFGLAQVWMDFMFSLHFLNNPFQVGAFDMGTAAFLIIMTSVVGYGFGWVATWVWNRIQKK